MLSHTHRIRQPWFSTLAFGTMVGFGLGILGQGTAQALSPYDEPDLAAITCEDAGAPTDVPVYDASEEPNDCIGLCMSECAMDCDAACAEAQDVGACRCECAHTCPDACEDECNSELDILYDPESGEEVDAATCSVDESNASMTSALVLFGLFAFSWFGRKRE